MKREALHECKDLSTNLSSKEIRSWECAKKSSERKQLYSKICGSAASCEKFKHKQTQRVIIKGLCIKYLKIILISENCENPLQYIHLFITPDSLLTEGRKNSQRKKDYKTLAYNMLIPKRN